MVADRNKHDLIVVMRDFNVKLGENNNSMEEVIRRHGVGNKKVKGCVTCAVQWTYCDWEIISTQRNTKKRSQ